MTFFDMYKSKQDLNELISSYNTRPEDLIIAFNDTYPHLKDKGTKNHVTRLIKKLNTLSAANKQPLTPPINNLHPAPQTSIQSWSTQ